MGGIEAGPNTHDFNTMSRAVILILRVPFIENSKKNQIRNENGISLFG